MREAAGGKSSSGCWELNLSPLENLPTLFPAEPCLQPRMVSLDCQFAWFWNQLKDTSEQICENISRRVNWGEKTSLDWVALSTELRSKEVQGKACWSAFISIVTAATTFPWHSKILWGFLRLSVSYWDCWGTRLMDWTATRFSNVFSV